MRKSINVNTQGGMTVIRVAAISAVTITKNWELRIFTGDNTMFTVNSNREDTKQQFEDISALLSE